MEFRVPTPVREGDFRLFAVGEEPRTKLSLVAQKWLNPQHVQQNVEELVAAADIKFARSLFRYSSVVGVLQCGMTTKFESDTEWILLANSIRVQSSEISLSRVVNSKPGEFVFLPVSYVGSAEAFGREYPNVQLTPLKRFFLSFGKLRISMPHLGGAYFRSAPSPCPPEMIYHKLGDKRWKGSSIFYVAGYRNYFILNEQGEVGYVPIDPDQPIYYYARDFDAFLERWLHELYRDQ